MQLTRANTAAPALKRAAGLPVLRASTVRPIGTRVRGFEGGGREGNKGDGSVALSWALRCVL